MAEPSSIWAVLLPVIVGGGIAALGGAAGQLFTHMLASRSAARAKREALFEKIIETVFEHDHWLDLKRNSEVFGEKKELPYSPIRRAVASATLYFPPLSDALKELDAASDEYQIWIHTSAQRRLNGDIAKLNDGFRAAYDPYVAARRHFHEVAANYLIEKKGNV